jgi:uncharacterized protein (TIGR02646 family)
MLGIRHRDLPVNAAEILHDLQIGIDAEPDYPTKVSLAHALWDARRGTKDGRAAFTLIRDTLAAMCIGSVRCAYCEDSLADEVEHIRPKSLFPEFTFVWSNYCFACGPCNGPKGNRHATIIAGALSEFIRRRGALVVAPPPGRLALIDPRSEDPTEFLELELGGQLPDGQVLVGTFEFLPKDNLPMDDIHRAEFTIEVLGLNREVIRAARANAFGGFRARLAEYARALEDGAGINRLEDLKSDLLKTPHLTVFHEMRRQQAHLPDIQALFARAPAALDWPLTGP